MDINQKIDVDYTQLFQILDSPYIVFGIDDPDFTILAQNDAHAAVSMTTQSETVGKPVLVVFPDTSTQYQKTGKSELLESIRRVIKTGKPDTLPDLNYDLQGTDGKLTPKYWSLTHFPIRDAKGKLVAVMQKTEDISAQKNVEQKLEHTRYQLEQALSNNSIGTWAWDMHRDLILTDANLADMFGIPKEDAAAGLPLSQFLNAIHPVDRARVVKEIGGVVDRGGAFESEYRTINTEGDIRWVIARGKVELDRMGKAISFPGVVVDITDRRNAENNLTFLTKASMQFSASLDYEKTLETIAAMVVPDIADWCTVDLLDEAGKLRPVIVAHKDPAQVAWAKQLRATQEVDMDDGSNGIMQVIRTGKAEFYPEITDEMLKQSAHSEEEYELLHGLGFSSVMIVPLKVDKKVIGAISLVAAESRMHYKPSDLEVAQGLANRASLAVENANLYKDAQREIKERKRLQKQLEQVNDALESRVKQRTKEIQSVNQGLEQEIVKRHEAEQAQEEYSQELMRSNQELQDFAYVASHDLQEPLRKIQSFGDLLEAEYAKKLGDGAEYLGRMRNAAARMSTLIQDLLAFSRVTTKEHASVPVKLAEIVGDVVIDLEDRIERTDGMVEVEPLPIVLADPTHMRQLFQNLIGNALKFHREGVPPVVRVYRDTKTHKKMCTIYVEDNGIGFDEKYLDRIFSVFQRLHGREDYEGTGIGLAVCRKIVERYNGTITAESTSGQGSKFIITLPVTN